MSLLRSIRDDLLSARMLPLLIASCVALVASLVFVLSGSGSGSGEQPQPISAVQGSTGSLGAVSAAGENPNAAVSETTSGVRYQNRGSAHDPFTPQITRPAKTTTTTTSSAPPASTTGESTTQTSSTPAPTPAPTPPPAGEEGAPKHNKPKQATVYEVDIEFGLSPSEEQQPQLKAYANLERLQAIPSAHKPVLVFNGVSSTGKGAIFTIVREAIIAGEARCLPSRSQCEMVDLGAGQDEQLSVLDSNNETVSYTLRVVSVRKQSSASTASAQSARVSAAGRKLLAHSGIPGLRHLRFSASKGVLLYLPDA